MRSGLRKSRGDVICLQETKLNEKNLDYVGVVLPSYFDRDVAVLDACGTKGGCLIAWRRCYTRISSWATKNTVSALLQDNYTSTKFMVTCVYGPFVDSQKREFFFQNYRISNLS